MNTIETLESRRMLAATLTSNGTLNIRATSRDDVIRLGFDDTFVNTVAVTINGEQRLFQGRDVKRINLDALTGHDRIYVDRSLSGLGGIKLNIDPGRGEDQIRIENLGRVKVMLNQITRHDRLIFDSQAKLYHIPSSSQNTSTESHVAGGSAAIFFNSITVGNVTGDGTIVVMGDLIPRSNLGSGSNLSDDLYLDDDSHLDSGSNAGDEQQGDGNLVLTESGYRYIGDIYELFASGAFDGPFENITIPDQDWGQSYSSRTSLPSQRATAQINDSLLLAGYNAGTKNLTQHPDLTDKQLRKIKPGIVSIDASWEVTRVGTEGKIVWLKVRGDATQRNIELNTTIERTDGKTVDPSKYPAGVKERKLKVSFMAIHRDSLLAIGGLTGESAVPIAPSYANANGVVFASNAKLRLMNDWSDSHSVNDKVPLEPGVNPHGRRGIIVDDGIIWFDDVERPYFQKISL